MIDNCMNVGEKIYIEKGDTMPIDKKIQYCGGLV